MANTVYDTKEILLQDGKEVVLKPLPLGLLKKLMKAWQSIADAQTEDDIFEVYLQCSGICLSREFKGDFNKPLNVDGTLADDYHEHLEEILDLYTIYEVLDICGGLKLKEENLAELAEAATEAMEQESPGET